MGLFTFRDQLPLWRSGIVEGAVFGENKEFAVALCADRGSEVYGEIYPGYAGIKGMYIESIRFEGLYIVGQSEESV